MKYVGDDRALVNQALRSWPQAASIVPSFLGCRIRSVGSWQSPNCNRPTAMRPLDGAWWMDVTHSTVGLWPDCRPRPRGRSPTHKANGISWSL